MRSYYKYRFWFISLVVHLCLAVVFSIIIINQTTLTDVEVLDVRIFKIETVSPVKKILRIDTPPIAPAPTPNFQIERQLAQAQTRALTAHPVRSTSVSVLKAVAAAVSISQPPAQSAHTQISVQGASQSSRANDQPAQSLTTAVDLPLQSDAPLAAGLSGNSSLSGSGGIGKGKGSDVGRGTFSSGSGANQTWGKNRAGLGSLVTGEETANIDDTLSDVAEKVTLGGGVPELPPRTPGAIVVGRGRDIMGRLNLVRFEDPLHPTADICGNGIGNLRFGAGLSYLVQSLNQKTQIKTQLVDAVHMKDTAFFQAPIIFMEPIPGGSRVGPEHLGRVYYSHSNPIWNTVRPGGLNKYTEAEIQRLREYVINRGGFLYILTHGNTDSAMKGAKKLLRSILPEYHLGLIPNDHSIYNTYYSLSGPLRFPLREVRSASGHGIPLHFGPYSELQGITIDGRLAVLVDTEQMMHVIDGKVQKPFYGKFYNQNKILEEFAPHAARQLINIVIYAITHGNISDYSNYVPETVMKDSDNKGLRKKAPIVTQKL